MRESKGDSENTGEFAVSMWRIVPGVSATQVDEYQFDSKPSSKKFFVSHDKKSLILILEDSTNKYISQMLSLSTSDLSSNPKTFNLISYRCKIFYLNKISEVQGFQKGLPCVELDAGAFHGERHLLHQCHLWRSQLDQGAG